MEKEVINNLLEEVVLGTGTAGSKTNKPTLLDLVINSNEEEIQVDNSNLLDLPVHQGIYNDLEEIEPITFRGILDMYSNESCVSIKTTRPVAFEKIYNQFSYSTYTTKELVDKYNRVTKSEKMLVIKEYIDYESESYSEDNEAVEATVEIPLNDIELLGYNPTLMELTIYLTNGSQVWMYA